MQTNALGALGVCSLASAFAVGSTNLEFVTENGLQDSLVIHGHFGLYKREEIKRALSKAPPIPIILFFGNPVALCTK